MAHEAQRRNHGLITSLAATAISILPSPISTLLSLAVVTQNIGSPPATTTLYPSPPSPSLSTASASTLRPGRRALRTSSYASTSTRPGSIYSEASVSRGPLVFHNESQLRRRGDPPSPSPGSSPTPAPAPIQMQLSTHCACGEQVAVPVPAWMMNAIEVAQNASEMRGAELGQNQDEELRGDRRSRRGSEEGNWREGFVRNSVRVAVAVKESPLPPLIIAVVKTLFVFILYLERRFALQQKLVMLLSAILESLITLEKEVGVFRKAGETLSVLWEASVKSTIALARTDPAPPASMMLPQSSSSTSYFPRTSTSSGSSASSTQHHHHSSSSITSPSIPLSYLPSFETEFETESESTPKQSRTTTASFATFSTSAVSSAGAGVGAALGRSLRRTTRSFPSLTRQFSSNSPPEPEREVEIIPRTRSRLSRDLGYAHSPSESSTTQRSSIIPLASTPRWRNGENDDDEEERTRVASGIPRLRPGHTSSSSQSFIPSHSTTSRSSGTSISLSATATTSNFSSATGDGSYSTRSGGNSGSSGVGEGARSARPLSTSSSTSSYSYASSLAFEHRSHQLGAALQTPRVQKDVCTFNNPSRTIRRRVGSPGRGGGVVVIGRNSEGAVGVVGGGRRRRGTGEEGDGVEEVFMGSPEGNGSRLRREVWEEEFEGEGFGEGVGEGVMPSGLEGGEMGYFSNGEGDGWSERRRGVLDQGRESGLGKIGGVDAQHWPGGIGSAWAGRVFVDVVARVVRATGEF